MNESHQTDNLGRLPKADRNSELQELSINAFRSVLPVEKFIFRDERINDVGVDGSLELKINSRSTNLRAQVQLKATESYDANKDESISIPVTVANLNYLLNGPSPLYVLFVVQKDELRFVWARDERKRLEDINPNWSQQDHVTLRFQNLLHAGSIDQIHERIQKEAQLQRKITDTLGTASNADSVVVSINPETLDVTNADEAQRILVSSGTLIVTAGYPEQVQNLARLLDATTAQLPRILLVRAYAEYMLGRYPGAYAFLSQAMLARDELSEDDQQFLEFLRDGCDYQAGRLTLAEFAARLDSKERNPASGFALSHRINQLKYEILLQRDSAGRSQSLQALRSLISEVMPASDSSQAFKLYAREALLEAEGYHLTRCSFVEIGEARMRMQVGRQPNLNELLQRQGAEFLEWEREMVSLINEATHLQHPLLVASTVIVRASVYHMFLSNLRALGLMFELPLPISQEIVQGFISDISRVVSVYSEARQYEGELRGKMLIADFYDLIDRGTEAQEIAREVLPKSKALGYAIISARAEEHLSGKSLMNKFQFSWKETKTEEEKAIENANESDDEMLRNAAQMVRVLELPAERLPVMERAYSSRRDCAREQASWCRHIDLLENRQHELSPTTMYRTDPPRVCICKLYGYRSIFPHPDWNSLFAAFKKTYCEGCKDRSAFQASRTASSVQAV